MSAHISNGSQAVDSWLGRTRSLLPVHNGHAAGNAGLKGGLGHLSGFFNATDKVTGYEVKSDINPLIVNFDRLLRKSACKVDILGDKKLLYIQFLLYVELSAINAL